ncbi:hypothetical protein LINPERHAP1_LOCUS16471 [Linum perenne]
MTFFSLYTLFGSQFARLTVDLGVTLSWFITTAYVALERKGDNATSCVIIILFLILLLAANDYLTATDVKADVVPNPGRIPLRDVILPGWLRNQNRWCGVLSTDPDDVDLEAGHERAVVELA